MERKIIVFCATWCNPCKVMHRNLDEIGAKVEYYDVEEYPDMVERYGIMSVPTMIAIDCNGNELCRYNQSPMDKSMLATFCKQWGGL